MPRTWSSQSNTDETCGNCGAVYAVTLRRCPTRDNDSFNCTVCGELMNSWRATTYPTYTLKKPGHAPDGD